MTYSFAFLPGLPSYGEPAIPFPPEWGRRSAEGTVVEFHSTSGDAWTANVQRGVEGITELFGHPNGHGVIVLSRGDLWVIDPVSKTAEQIAAAITDVWPVAAPAGMVFSRQGLAFLRLAASGIVWHTRRLSWDGFRDVRLEGTEMRGKAWNAVHDCWSDFRVDLITGQTTGGSFSFDDTEKWERLATAGNDA